MAYLCCTITRDKEIEKVNIVTIIFSAYVRLTINDVNNNIVALMCDNDRYHKCSLYQKWVWEKRGAHDFIGPGGNLNRQYPLQVTLRSTDSIPGDGERHLYLTVV